MGRLYAASLITLSVLASFVLFTVTAALLFVGAFDLTIAIPFTVIVNLILWRVGPWFTDLINRAVYSVRFLTEDELRSEHPGIHRLIAKVCEEHRFKFPKVGIIPDKNPTAFTYGSARFNSRVVLTEGLFHYLDGDEVAAVVAHEMGHIVNRDFVVMMIASTLLQILYEIYAYLSRARGKNADRAKAIAFSAYILYLAGTYLLLYLSRTREYLADEFSARVASAGALAKGLIKVAYGIVAADDTDASKHLLKSTRHLGIVDVKNARYLGAASTVATQDPQIIGEILAFDRLSPWAFVIEINSTHPLTGKRLGRLAEVAAELGQPFPFDFEGALARVKVDSGRLYGGFAAGVGFYFAPVLGTLLGLGLAITTDSIGLLPLCLGIAMLARLLYRFPTGKAAETTVLDEMRNLYASPVRGKPVALRGKVIGRGDAGNVVGEDMMFQDPTGLTFLDYNSGWGFIGNIFFGWRKVKTLIGAPSAAEGWFFRDMSSHVALKQLKTESETIRSHPMLWSLVVPVLLILAGIVLR